MHTKTCNVLHFFQNFFSFNDRRNISFVFNNSLVFGGKFQSDSYYSALKRAGVIIMMCFRCAGEHSLVRPRHRAQEVVEKIMLHAGSQPASCSICSNDNQDQKHKTQQLKMSEHAPLCLFLTDRPGGCHHAKLWASPFRAYIIRPEHYFN